MNVIFCVNSVEILGAVNLKLTEEEMKELQDPYRPQGVFGHT